MTKFQIEVVGHRVVVKARFETTRAHCAGFLCDGEADFSLEITPEDIAFEREESLRRNGRADQDTYLELIALLRKVSEGLLEYDTLLFHGSVIAVDGTAYLFTAPSGTGKSTHTRLWRQMLGSRAVMVNDDKPFLRITETGVLACGSPWNGKHRLGTNTSVPLKAICILERGEENEIHPIPAREALSALFQQSARPKDRRRIRKYMELLDRLSRGVEFYRLCCNMDLEAARVAFETMCGM
ncbi:MAG: hypothetical protein IJX37_07085 [Oscillospiraceae bacterium]|nr:hypothetical protein [Oscillospiraceae bacterium]